MPSAAILEQKKQSVVKLAEKMKTAVAGVVVDYRGINADNDTKLRRKLREAGVDYFVIKNSLLRFAAKEADFEGLLEHFVGTTAVAVASDPVIAAKILNEYAAASRGKYSIKAGFIEGKVIDAKGVEALAKLPSREVLVAQALAGLNAPITSFVSVLNANIRGLAVALSAILEQKSA